jgi:hypothetical protein
MESLALRTAVRTPNVRRKARRWGETTHRQGHVKRSVQQLPTVSHANLIESDEYEWATPLSLPGLVVAARATPAQVSLEVRHSKRTLADVIETEDGDAISATQIPGCLSGHSGASLMEARPARTRNELADEDEYVDVAAWQLPGQLSLASTDVHQSPETSIRSRGLCATCLYRDSCDFPRREGGVWQCEEYA